ncbi:pyridoxamine 5'-phosphate oxidase family protein [Chitinophagaceae bacterium LB-8]|uniref:Pyridoxamine 5'-phosphate oxidase family protein n=1 Tax=Paraflavisolibacter caeni TaxID=2982496 RepID=A0A9X3BHW4_9BACT|nr:pyridoxamine 5'-phosphate oxidase family protein [Paraflavisolibacter caeni]MCU7550297.1 pyridoxamine 5'-phosphate oxidase family protein [Paraflavisolibacter caeni]
MNASILDFIKEQKVATVCCLDEKGFPYSFNCFYAFNSSEGLLYFKSSPSSDHSKFLTQRPHVAGTILPGKLNYLALRGIQYTGVVLPSEDALCQNASADYHKKFPFALAKSGELYTILLESIKMTDNTKGFGTKILWERGELALNHSN